MKIDINLLPKRERQKENKLLLPLLFILCAVGIGGGSYWYVGQLEAETVELTNEVREVQRDRLIAEQKLQNYRTSDDVQKLNDAVKWATLYPVEIQPFVKEITRLLPERGFFTAFALAKGYKATLSVQFDTKKQMADYMQRLSDAPFLAKVALVSTQVKETEVVDEATDDKTKVPRVVATFTLQIDTNALKKFEQKGASE